MGKNQILRKFLVTEYRSQQFANVPPALTFLPADRSSDFLSGIKDTFATGRGH